MNETKKAGKWHPSLSQKIQFIKGDSVGDETLKQVREAVEGKSRVLVLLDSLHTREHVIKELELYSPLVSPGSYIFVNDTHHDRFSDAHKGEGPLAAAQHFAALDNDFELVTELPKHSMSAMHDGIFRRKGELPPIEIRPATDD